MITILKEILFNNFQNSLYFRNYVGVIPGMKIHRYILFSLLLILVRIPAAGAQDEVDMDSIKTMLQSLDGEAHFRLLIELSDNESLEADTRVQYADDAVEYAQDLDRTEFISEAYINLGNLQH